MLLTGFEDLTKENLTNVFQEHFDSKLLSVTVKEKAREFAGVNDQFQSDIRKLGIKISRNRGEDEEMSVVVKTTPRAAAQRFSQRVARPFLSEVMWYSQALPALAAHHPELTSISPVCYYGSSNFLKNCHAEDYWEAKCGHGNWGFFFKMMHRKDEAGLLLLEDVTKGSDPMFPLDKTRVLSLKQVVAAVKALATFHGVWWTWLRKEGKTESEDGKLRLADVEEVYSKGKRSPIRKNAVFLSMMKVLVKVADQHGNKDMSCRLKKYFDTMWLDVPSLEDPPKEDSLFRTVVHGDAWVNNMMFSSNDPEAVELRVKLLDFASMTMGHPARDLWYLLQTGTDPDFRSKHLDTVFEEYYEVFSSYLEASGAKVEISSFRAECEKWRAPVSLLLGNFVSFICLNPEPQSLDTWSAFKKLIRDLDEKLAGEAKDTDHPMMKEIRRRIIEGILELDALGLFD